MLVKETLELARKNLVGVSFRTQEFQLRLHSVDKLVAFVQLKMVTAFVSHTALRQLSQFFAAVVFFHTTEYILAIFFHGRSSVTLSSLLISKNYVIALSFSLLEYMLEIAFFPGLKELWWISNLGLVMVLLGEIIRKTAIITAGHAFTHMIRKYHEEHHMLVTHGIYRDHTLRNQTPLAGAGLSWVNWTWLASGYLGAMSCVGERIRFIRHPGYCGFFIWATGSQIMLCNPLCIVAFALVTWRFFSTRIPYEEYFLRQFFGSEYEEYAKRVPSGVPFIK
uniref:Protein-S-isoprenylcysteine O-methyltransferase n=1 Tax=Nelumbo nucifera TaxID=4432 RepID=A0A822Y7H3_NELNU|nr:TPA_asm: hypothetical protein HUJ06_028999 [Nelumbo nucifera]